MSVWTLLNFSLLTGGLLAGSVALSVRFIPAARATFLGLLTYSGFVFLCCIVGVQMLAGWCDALTVTGVSIVGYASVVALWSLGLPSALRHCPLPRRPSVFLLLLAPLAGFLLLELFTAFLLPVWEYDSVSYHMPMIVQWVAHHSLRDAFFSVYAGPVGYYPGTGESLTLWSVNLLRADVFANAQNFFLVLLLVATSLELTRRLRLPDRCGVLFPLLFLSSPVVLKEVGTEQVDLFFALAFLYCLLFLLAYRDGDGGALMLFSLALGLFLGSKYLAIPFALLFLPVAVVLLYRRERKVGWKRLSLLFLACALCFLLMGGLWYVRNVLLTGNPIFPATVALGRWILLQGYGAMTGKIFSASLWQHLGSLSSTEMHSIVHLFVLRTGYQTLFEGVIWLGYVLWLAGSWVVRGRPRHPWINVFLTLSFPLFLILYATAPSTYTFFEANIRYSILFFLIGALIVAFVAGQRRWLWAALTIFSVAIVSLTVWNLLRSPELPLFEVGTLRFARSYNGLFLPFALRIGTVVSVLAVALVLPWSAFWRRRVLIVSLFLLPAAFCLGNGKIFAEKEQRAWLSYQEKYPEFTPLIHAFSWVDQHVQPGETVAYAGFHFNYPLYGAHLDRDVRYVAVNNCLDCNYVDFRDDPEGIFAGASRTQWLQNLQSEHVTYLVLFNEFGYMKYEPTWVQESGGIFSPVLQQGGVSLYRVHFSSPHTPQRAG